MTFTVTGAVRSIPIGRSRPYNFREPGNDGTADIETAAAAGHHSDMSLSLSFLITTTFAAALWLSWRIVLYRRNQNDLRSMRTHLEKLSSGQE
jgi:hypothetical protein